MRLIAAALLLAAVPAFAAQNDAREAAVSPAESLLKWKGTKVSGEHYGTIKLKDGSIKLKNGAIVGGSFAIDMGSIVCDDLSSPEWNQKLVGHLKSEDFFSTGKFPTSEFKIKKVSPLKKPEGEWTHQVTGLLTIKGISHSLSFPAKLTVGADAAEARALVKVDRTRYKIQYGSGKFFKGLGDKMIHDEFSLDLALKAPLK